MSFGGNDLFMATVEKNAGFDLGDFAKKGKGKAAFIIWHVNEDGGSINSKPVIKNEHVYIACLDKYLYKLDKRTGEENWKFKASGMFCDSLMIAIFIASQPKGSSSGSSGHQQANSPLTNTKRKAHSSSKRPK